MYKRYKDDIQGTTYESFQVIKKSSGGLYLRKDGHDSDTGHFPCWKVIVLKYCGDGSTG